MTNPSQNVAQRRLVIVLLHNLRQRVRLAFEVGASSVHDEVDRVTHALVAGVRSVQNVVSGPIHRERDLFVGVGVRHASSWHATPPAQPDGEASA